MHSAQVEVATRSLPSVVSAAAARVVGFFSYHRRSVSEVPDAGEDEGHPVLVAAVHGVLVPDAAAGLRDHRDAALARLLHRIVPSCITAGSTTH